MSIAGQEKTEACGFRLGFLNYFTLLYLFCLMTDFYDFGFVIVIENRNTASRNKHYQHKCYNRLKAVVPQALHIGTAKKSIYENADEKYTEDY